MNNQPTLSDLLELCAICDDLAAFQFHYRTSNEEAYEILGQSRTSILQALRVLQTLAIEAYTPANVELCTHYLEHVARQIENNDTLIAQPVMKQIIAIVRNAIQIVGSGDIFTTAKSEELSRFFNVLEAARHDGLAA